MLAVIVLQWIIGGMGAKSSAKEEYGISAFTYIVTFTVLGSLLASTYSQETSGSGMCSNYLSYNNNFNAPRNVLFYQIAVCWSFVFLGLVNLFLFFL